MTAIEVLTSTLLASLLMTALVGVLRGLKATEHALEMRLPAPSWKISLDAALSADLGSAITCTWTPNSLTLEGYGGRDSGGAPTWLPSTVTYSVEGAADSAWLVRREAPGAGGGASIAPSLVLRGVQQIRVAAPPQSTDGSAGEGAPAGAFNPGVPSPIGVHFFVEFWGEEELLYSYCHHAP